MGPAPDRRDFLAEENYREQLNRWRQVRDNIEAERRRQINNLGNLTSDLEGTFGTTANFQPAPSFGVTLNQWRSINADTWAEEETEDVEEIPMDKIEKIMKERHLTKAERQALHRPKSDWIEGKRGEECRAACELKVDDLVPSTLRVKKVVKQR